MLIFCKNNYAVYKLKTKRCVCYIVSYKGKNILIDTSMKFERKKLISELVKIGKTNIDALFITHNHKDHIANAAWLSRKYDCPIYICNKVLQDVKRGVSFVPRPTTRQAKIVYWLALYGRNVYDFCKYEPCENSHPLTSQVVEHYLGPGVILMETEGHTSDSISLLIEDEIAIVGDAMVNIFGKIYPPFADQEELVYKTWKMLLDTPIQIFLPAHGKPISRQTASIALKRLLLSNKQYKIG